MNSAGLNSLTCVAHPVESCGLLGERRARGAPPKQWPTRATELSQLSLLLADLAATLVVTGALLISSFWFAQEWVPIHWGWSTAFVGWLLFRAASGLYVPYGSYPPDELRRSFRTTTVAFLLNAAILSASGDLHGAHIAGLLLWPLVLPIAFLSRSLVRHWLISRGRYGVPVAIVGNGESARCAIREILDRPDLGYVPVAAFTTEMTAIHERRSILGVPLAGRSEAAVTQRFPYRVEHAILAVGSGWGDERNHILAEKLAARFPNLQIFSNLVGQGHWLAQARPIGAYLAIETRHARFAWHQRLLKRSLDLALCIPALLLAAPFFLMAGLAILIVDPGPIFFSQVREGRHGKPIRIYKLRSMVRHAESRLASYLAQNVDARLEYERTLKLRNDPRIIPLVGNFLRRTSIDELPQLWNVIKGDMSLVGPRVFLKQEVEMYSDPARELRRDMLPGLTGFWQVEHRSNAESRMREVADSFYVANWSIWLDLWIILRTVRIVLTGSGAY